MTLPRIQAAIALVLMVMAYVGAQAWRPTAHMADTRPKVDLERMFPKQFGDWRIDERMPVQLVSPDLQAQLDLLYNQTLSRTYINREGERIMLSVAYGGDQSDGTRAHLPEVCYPAQGFDISGKTEGTIIAPGHAFRVQHLVARVSGRVEPITYWLVIGDQVATSGTQIKLAQLRYSLTGVIPDGMLVRVSNISSNVDQSYRLQAGFVVAMTGAMEPEVGRRITGQSSP